MIGAPAIGSEDHKRLFCSTFIETHNPYAPEDVAFPDIDDAGRARLASLPIWDEAVNTERETAYKVQRMAELEPDALVREAIALQGFEEGRHAALLDRLTQRYGIAVQPRVEPAADNPTWEFIRTEYGECFDAFFAFGLFAIARDSGFFPPSLVTLFDPIMQEEARHVLFFVNWIAFRRTRMPRDLRLLLDFRRGLAVALQILSRVRTAFDLGGAEQDNFAMHSHTSLGDFSLRSFLELCLRENQRRLGVYDAGLLQPRFVPHMAQLALRVLRP
ncbi:MAG: ferritin-like domain-containing protein [Candidatus Binatia bacterium]